MRVRATLGVQYVLMLLLVTVVSCSFLAYDELVYHTNVPFYMAWNLFLAWIPFLLSMGLVRYIKRHAWSSWFGMVLSIAWLAFLPNSFYMVSDFIHLSEIADSAQLLFSAVMFMAFIATGVLLGLSSIYLVHRELEKRLHPRLSSSAIAIILFVCSIAIYIGRDLRWNTWDLLVDPAGMLFDVSMRLVHPANYGSIIGVVVPFMVLLGILYTFTWQAGRLVRSHSVR